MKKFILCTGLLFFCLNGFTQKNVPDPALASAARLLAAQITEKPRNLSELFDNNFFHNISLEKLSDILSGIYKSDGRVTAVHFERIDSAISAHFIFETENDFELPAALSINPDTGKISVLFFKTAYKKNLSIREFKEKLGRLDGKTGFSLRRFGVPSSALGDAERGIESSNENDYFAIGSAFKLYVLGALLEEGTEWEKIIYLKDEQKSLPSGRLQNWPDGAPLTVHTLAAMMISESDNTAADLLIDAVGRKTLEGDLQKLGHSNPALMRPFLKTSEIFRLKSDTESALNYFNPPLGDKYGFLSKLAARPLKAEDVKKSPFHVDKIEWLASPADLCRLMEYIHKKNDKQALDILAINTGLDIPPGKFLYAGYKGGAEPGVLNMTWLFKSKGNAWYCLSASWNNEKEDLDANKFFELMELALRANWE
ncbi:MAG: serine hydrolase [Elusimicrobia bacterium]|nr:serine hydrolase [Elusimicrobiota bacterium]